MLDGLLIFRRYSQKNMDKSHGYSCLGLLLMVLLGMADAGADAGAEAQMQLPPVDIVYAWVDGSDPFFRQRFAQATNSSVRCDRVEASNELLMGLTAICKHQRWVRQVFIVVDQQHFSLDFLPPGCPPVSFVDLSTFVPQQYLPTFNSHVFETFLWRIPGLSDHFIYLNDDMILARPINAANLFQQSDAVAWGVSVETSTGEPHGKGNTTLMKANLRPRPYKVPHPDAELPESAQWLWPRFNGLELFKSAFSNADPAGFDPHSAVLLSKQAMEKTWELVSSKLDGPLTSNKKRRYASLKHGGDVHFTSLAQQVGVQLGLMIHDSPLVALNVAHDSAAGLAQYVQALFNGRAHVVCVQDLRKLKDQDLAKLCSLVSDVWCSTVPHTKHQRWSGDRCGVFVQMCSNRGAHCIGNRRLSLLRRH